MRPVKSRDGIRITPALLLKAVAELSARDADLSNVVTRFGPPPLWMRPAGFATLARIVLEQQVSLASARAGFARLRRGVGSMAPARLAALSLRELRALGLTRQKAAYLREMAHAVATGTVSLRSLSALDDATARAALLQLNGVGPWTADIYLLFALGRPDVWPEGDLALARSLKAVKRLRSEPEPERARRLALEWSPWRSVAARILWHHYLSERDHRHALSKLAGLP